MSAIRELQEMLRAEEARAAKAESWLRFIIDDHDCVCYLATQLPCWVCQVRELVCPAPPPTPASPTKETP